MLDISFYDGHAGNYERGKGAASNEAEFGVLLYNDVTFESRFGVFGRGERIAQLEVNAVFGYVREFFADGSIGRTQKYQMVPVLSGKNQIP